MRSESQHQWKNWGQEEDWNRSLTETSELQASERANLKEGGAIEEGTQHPVLLSIHVFMGIPRGTPPHTIIFLTQLVRYGGIDMSGRDECGTMVVPLEHHEIKPSLSYLVLKARK